MKADPQKLLHAIAFYTGTGIEQPDYLATVGAYALCAHLVLIRAQNILLDTLENFCASPKAMTVMQMNLLYQC